MSRMIQAKLQKSGHCQNGTYLPDNDSSRIRGESVPRALQRHDDASDILASTTNSNVSAIYPTLQESQLDPQSMTSSPTDMEIMSSEGQPSNLQHSKGSSLLNLPAEIRNLIWIEIAAPTGTVWTYYEGESIDPERSNRSDLQFFFHKLKTKTAGEEFQSCILRTCKQMYKEISHVFYLHNEFSFIGVAYAYFFNSKDHSERNIPIRSRHYLSYNNFENHWGSGHCVYTDTLYGLPYNSEERNFSSFVIQWNLTRYDFWDSVAMYKYSQGDNDAWAFGPGMIPPKLEVHKVYNGSVHQDHLSEIRHCARLLDPYVYPTVSSEGIEQPCHKRFEVNILGNLNLLERSEDEQNTFLQMLEDFHLAFRADVYVEGILCYRDGIRVWDSFQDKILWNSSEDKISWESDKMCSSDEESEA